MTVAASLPRAVYPAGTRTLPAVSIPTGLTRLRITINRFNWVDTGADVLKFGIEFSLDGGATYAAAVPGEMTAVYGSARGGNVALRGGPDITAIDCPIPGNPLSTSRRVRATVQIVPAGGLDLSATVEVT